MIVATAMWRRLDVPGHDVAWLEQRANGWLLHGNAVFQHERRPAAIDAEGLLDLDYGFTPATNFIQLKRERMAIGERREITVAWTDIDQSSLTVLPQRYARISERQYAYSSPTSGYEATLMLDETGFVAEYPRLWIS